MSPFSIPPFPALNLLSLSFFFILPLLFFCHFLAFLPHSFRHSLLSSLIPPSSPPSLLYLFLFSPRIYGCLPVPRPTLHFTAPLPRTSLKLILTARTKWECTLLLISQRWKVVGALTKHLKDQARLVTLLAECFLHVIGRLATSKPLGDKARYNGADMRQTSKSDHELKEGSTPRKTDSMSKLQFDRVSVT